MEPTIIAGYTLEDRITVKGETYVLGHSAANPAPYVTWALAKDGSCHYGNYFTEETAARADLFRRALECLPEQEAGNIILSNLSSEARAAIMQEGREETHLDDIESCLYDALDHLGIDDSMVPTLMGNEEFKARALHVFYRQDHSSENEALTESLEDLINDKYPDLLPKEFIGVLKISPEEMDFMNDVLSTTKDEILKKYCSYEPESDMLIFHAYIQSPRGNRRIEIGITPKDGPETEKAISVSLSDCRSGKVITEKTLQDVTQFEQVFEITDKDGITWKLDLHADERLRRIGREYIFNTDSSEPLYESHNRKRCTVDRMLTASESDIMYCGLVWKARFEDGCVLDVYDGELIQPPERKFDLEQNPEQVKPIQPLESRLSDAHKRAETQAEQTPDRTPHKDITK